MTQGNEMKYYSVSRYHQLHTCTIYVGFTQAVVNPIPGLAVDFPQLCPVAYSVGLRGLIYPILPHPWCFVTKQQHIIHPWCTLYILYTLLPSHCGS